MEIGDEVTRMLVGTIPLRLKITAITEDRIICGEWEFDKKTGAEIDDYFNWGPPHLLDANGKQKYAGTGSFIKIPGVEYVEIHPLLR